MPNQPKVAVSSDGNPNLAPSRREQQRKERSDAICTAALDLFVVKGIEVVTIDEITVTADTAKGNFYRYFKDKETLVSAIMEPFSKKLVCELRTCEQALLHVQSMKAAQDAYVALTLQFLMHILQSPKVARLYLQESRAPATQAHRAIQAFNKDLHDSAYRLTDLAIKNKLLHVAHPQVTALTVLGAAEKLTLALIDGTLTVDPATAGKILVDVILFGMGRENRQN
jgi:AcrR family transcriptional regulator